jgi:LuxR family maltose regulon positive regulatory protein
MISPPHGPRPGAPVTGRGEIDESTPEVGMENAARAPRTSETHIVRERLLAALDEWRPLTVLRAPSGYGKTVLAAQWAARAQAAGEKVVWLDAGRMSGAEVHDAVSAAAGRDAARVMVVVESFDMVEDPVLGRELASMLAGHPWLHLMVLARRRPEFELRSRLDLNALVVDRDMLRFTPDEVAELAVRLGVEAVDEDVAAVAQDAGGWPLLTGLTLLHLQGGFSAAVRDSLVQAVRTALRHERVASTLTPGALAAAQLLAHVRHLSADIAAEILGNFDDVRAELVDVGVLDETVAPGAAVGPLPPLARSVLLASVRPEQAGDVAAVHATAVEGHLARGRVEHAVEQALDGGLWRRVADLVAEHWWELLIHHPDVLARAATEPPAEVLGSHARSRLVRDIFRGGADMTTPQYHLPADDAVLDVLARGEEGRRLLDEATLTMVALRLGGAHDEALAVATQAVRLADRISPLALPSPEPSVRLAHLHVGLTFLLAGDLGRALGSLRSAYGTDVSVEPQAIRRDAAGKAALVCALLGDLGAAETWLLRSEQLMKLPGWMGPHAEAARHIAYALVAIGRLDRAAALEHLSAFDSSGGVDELWSAAMLARGQLALTWGGAEAALHEVQTVREMHPELVDQSTLADVLCRRVEADLLMSLGRSGARDVLRAARRDDPLLEVARGREALLRGDDDGALLAVTALEHAEHVTPRVRLESALIAAHVRDRRGESALATQLVGGAIMAARRRHDLRVLTGVPRSLLESHGTDVPELAAVLAELDVVRAREAFPSSIDGVTLTPREHEVLRQLATGQSLENIASTMFVSRNTVKSQTRTLYRKLGVGSRDEAVLAGYSLGLLRRA